MSSSQRSRPKIDESLLHQVAALPPGGQRWLRTALQAIVTLEPLPQREEKGETSARRRKARQPRPSLDEVLSGEADPREQAEAYPELAEDLQGIADIADLLREAGRQRRSRGEEILRESEEESPDSDEEADRPPNSNV